MGRETSYSQIQEDRIETSTEMVDSAGVVFGFVVVSRSRQCGRS